MESNRNADNPNIRLADQFQHALTSRLRIRQLHIFMGVYEAQNILAASRQLSLDHSTVSKAISDMERALNLQLFKRRSRGVTSTEAGDVLYRHGVRLVSQSQVTARELAQLSAGEIGQIRCGVVSFMDEFMARALARFKAKYPQVVVQLTFSNFQELQRRCELGHLDLVIGRLNTELRDTRLVSEVICEDPTSLVVKANHPLLALPNAGFADLVGYPWLLPPANSPLRAKIEQRFVDEQLPLPANVIECASMFVVRTMLDEIPHLITVPPRSIFSRHMAGKDYRLLPIMLFEHNSPIGFLSRPESIANAPLQALRKLVREALRPEEDR